MAKNKVCSLMLAYIGCQHRYFPTMDEKRVDRQREVSMTGIPKDMPCCATDVIHARCKWNGSSDAWNKEHTGNFGETKLEQIGLTPEFTRNK